MKAIALLSGGLDSILAAKFINELGTELVAFNTVSPFCLCARKGTDGCIHGAASAARQLGLKLISCDVADEFIEIVRAPKHGYGSNMNPCIDCRILLFRKAREAMEREGAGFLITGEVLGQRPMSQRLEAMKLIDREAGVEGLVLRPLSALHLEETIPERNGWVDRTKMLSITGRGRKDQFELARQFGINDFPCPSGGCLLTDPQFSRKIKNLLNHNELTLENARLLKIGRHFRLAPDVRLVVGRDERENGLLLSLARAEDIILTSETVLGPTALGKGVFDDELAARAAGIVLRYCDVDKYSPVALDLVRRGHPTTGVTSVALSEAEIEGMRI